MAKERIVAASAQASDEESVIPSIRPRSLAEYVGQTALKERLGIALAAARQRGRGMDHVLLHGPPGLGKTTLAYVIANEMGSHASVTSGPALTKGGDLVGTLTRMQDRDVLFIDEIHRLPAAVEEYIYPAMEDYRIDFTVDSGMHAKVVTINLKAFTLIGATTRPGQLTQALRTRFGITHHIGLYPEGDLLAILLRACAIMDVGKVGAGALALIAARSRGTPRVALRLLRRVHDWAIVRGDGTVSAPTVEAALHLEAIDSLGLDALDRTYLKTLGTTYEGGPVGVEAMAASIGEDSGTLEDVVEPYLLQIGFVARTRQGRRITRAGAGHVGIAFKAAAGTSDIDVDQSLWT
ncbi:MAG: Holliday junction branch migration DNA helicase RuvB [Phycisphaerales bacterium]|nr:Holliday junction branch migration DNA helicase RuvB [Phycisphaerales bacterium]